MISMSGASRLPDHHRAPAARPTCVSSTRSTSAKEARRTGTTPGRPGSKPCPRDLTRTAGVNSPSRTILGSDPGKAGRRRELDEELASDRDRCPPKSRRGRAVVPVWSHSRGGSQEPWSSGVCLRLFTAATRVRTPVGASQLRGLAYRRQSASATALLWSTVLTLVERASRCATVSGGRDAP
jgi:hypothetical protein